jgi:hypothetical protein
MLWPPRLQAAMIEFDFRILQTVFTPLPLPLLALNLHQTLPVVAVADAFSGMVNIHLFFFFFHLHFSTPRVPSWTPAYPAAWPQWLMPSWVSLNANLFLLLLPLSTKPN